MHLLRKKYAGICIESLRKELPHNLAVVVTRPLLGMGKGKAEALGEEGNLIITLYSCFYSGKEMI